ncbi:MAG TPA: ribosome silencing factor [Acidimicrobiales bacterium]|nr:ribosome silencing factor [Acidimicrobiales bacterium]
MSSATQRATSERNHLVPAESLVAARTADAKLGQDTAVLSMAGLLDVTDAFVITSGRNTRQVRTIVEEVERELKEHSDRSPDRIEGLHDLHWVLMDYGDFLVHVFLDETREYYALERLWGNAARVEWEDRTSA